MKYKAIVRKDEDGWYTASVPALPGCHSQGKSIEESLVNIEEAVRGYLAVCKKFGDPIPADDSNTIEATVTVQESGRNFSFA